MGERLLLPAYLGIVIAAIALIPVWRAGFATVVGQNGDAVLAVGSAELVKHAPPNAVREDLPIDRIPLSWRSKYPIFYPLAAASELSGLSVIEAFPIMCAALLAMCSFGVFLVARYAMGAGLAVALAAMAVVGLGRIPISLAVHPYYNQSWALFALPFMLLAGWRFLRAPTRGGAVLLALFGAAGGFAYPLMLPFPALFLAVGAYMRWREARASGEWAQWTSDARGRIGRAPTLVTVAAGIAAVALAAVLLRGVGEKTISAAVALSPWGSLDAWSGSALPYLPFHRFFGLVNPDGAALATAAVAAVVVAAAWGLWRAPRSFGVPMAAMLTGALAFGIYFRARSQAELFYFKDMSFAGAMVVMCAVVGLGELARRTRWLAVASTAALAGLAVVTFNTTRHELLHTYEYATRDVLTLRDWSHRLPPGATVRIDIPPSGQQLWADYMLADRPVSALHPLVGFFPYAPPGRRADYVLAMTLQRRPRDAAGPPLFASAEYRLWRMRPGVPGPDTSSRRMIDSITKVNLG